MRQARAIDKVARYGREAVEPVRTWARLPKAFAAMVIAGGIAAPHAILAATQGPVAVPAPAHAPEPAARLDAGKLADRTMPDMMGLQPIIVAQQSGLMVSDVSGPPDEPLPIEISLPPEDGDLFRVIMIRGLPDKFKLTVGVSLDDAWALSPSKVSRAALVAPSDYNGEFSMEVLFIRGNGEARQQEIVNVRIGPEPEPDRTGAAAEEPEAPQAQTRPLSPEVQKRMFERAERMMSGGDIAGARLILRYLAEHGIAGAAFAMGQSFDPGLLQDIYVRGEDPANVAKAREWYRRAAEMGSSDARSRLSALD